MPKAGSGSNPAETLRRHGLAPRKRLGQNFLQDRTFLARILDAAGVEAGDTVLEIGPGTGVLTRALAEQAGYVIAVELDDGLVQVLRAEFASMPQVQIQQGNALDVDPCVLLDSPYKVVGNIPYYITGPIIRHYLEASCRPDVLVFMVQREVAERITAHPGDLSLMGISVQYYASPTIVARVPAAAFYPRPRVDSAILRLVPHDRQPQREEARRFFDVARAGFCAPRKQVGNALSQGLSVSRSAADEILQSADIDPRRRAETLSVDEWNRLASVWSNSGREA